MSLTIQENREEGICILTLADDTGLQLLDREALRLLQQTFRRLDRDPEIRVLILTSREARAFSAGSDLGELATLDPDRAYEMSILGQSVTGTLAEFRAPTLVTIRGLAYGGGLELAISADFRIASPETRFSYPATRLGILPGYGGTQRLPQLVGPSRAKELMLLGRVIEAQEALSWGLVNAVDDDPLALAFDWARHLETRDAFALRQTKDCIANAEHLDFQSEQAAFSTCFAQPGVQDRLRNWQAARTDRDG